MSRLVRHVDYSLMKSIHESCGPEIEEEAAGDGTRCSVLAALTANGSKGAPNACRFLPAHHRILREKLEGLRSSASFVSRRDLERYLKKFGTRGQEQLLRLLASCHGYTLIAGYWCVRWNISPENLAEKSSHFSYANRLLKHYCERYGLDLQADLTRLGHLWSADLGFSGTRASMYVGRLRMRFELYERILKEGQRRAA